MPRANPLQSAFNAGEIGPRLASRVDFAKYQNAGARVENLIPLPQGGLARRPGTRFIAQAQDHTKRPRLFPFEFSTEQAYVLEGCDGCFRFFRDKGQIVVSDTDAVISNGTFDSGLADWDDRSGGGALINHEVFGNEEIDLLQFAQIGNQTFGDVAVNASSTGLRFEAPADGNVAVATLSVSVVAVAFDAVARIYTDVSGSPGVQVGVDSDTVTLNAAGPVTFSWSTKPVVVSGMRYWVVFSDITANGAGNVGVSQCSDQGAPLASGFNDTITSIADQSGGWTAGRDLRGRVQIETAASNGVLALIGSGGDVASAEQGVVTTNTGQEHVLRFRVIGAPGDTISVRIGNTSEGDQVLTETEVKTGFHSIAFTPEMSPFHVQFRNGSGKTVYVDDVALVGSGVGAKAPLELTTPYQEADLQTLKWAQSADVMYFAHPDHPPHKLERRGNTTWSLVEVDFDDGPYLDENTTGSMTLNPSAATGVGITISAAGHSPFSISDVGRLVRLRPSGDPGYAVITEFISPEQVKADVKRDFGNANATANWRLGAWSAGRGYPSVVTFFEQRLVWANTKNQPQSFWMSQSGDLERMRPDSFEGGAIEVQDDDGLDFTIAADQVNAIRWMSPGRQLILGTSGGEWSVTSDGPVLTPLDLTVRRESTNGSANILPVRISSIVLFVQRAKRKLREFVFSFETDGFRTPDLTILADHISESGIREVIYQQEPDSQVHCLREDGVLATLTYRREQDVVGWSRHLLGGSYQGGHAVIESMAAIPGSAVAGSENLDEAWVVVMRTINGVTRRYIEVFEPLFEGPNLEEFEDVAAFDAEVLAAQTDSFYVDSGLVLDNPVNITGIDLLAFADGFEVWPGGVSAPPEGWTQIGGVGSVGQEAINGVTEGSFSVVFGGSGATLSKSFDFTGVDRLVLDFAGAGKEITIEVDGNQVFSEPEPSGSRTIDVSSVTGTQTLALIMSAISAGSLYVDNLRFLGAGSGASRVVVTAPAHGLAEGDSVDLTGIVGLEELNGQRFTIANVTTDTFELTGADASGLGLYQSGGEARLAVTTIAGLDHLEGETVKIQGNGATLPEQVVSGGAITIDVPVSKAVVGLGYRHIFKSLKLASGAAAGTAVAKVKRVHGVALVLLHSLGIRIGPSLDRLEDVPLREVKDAMDAAVPLFTGERYVSFDGDYERDARIVIAGDAPLPFTLLAAAPELKTNEQV